MTFYPSVQPPEEVPGPTPAKEIHRASFSCLKAMYNSERNVLVKQAPKLSYKTLYPTNLERQQVALVCNIFNEFNVAALESTRTDEAEKKTARIISTVTEVRQAGTRCY